METHFRKKLLMIIISVIAVIIIVIAAYYIFSYISFKKQLSELSNTVNPNANNSSLKRETRSKNETFSEQGYELQIISIEIKQSFNDTFTNETIEPKSGELVLVKLAGKNLNNAPSALSEDGFLLEADGKKYSLTQTYQSNGCLLCESNPNSTQEEIFIWDIPKGSTDLKLLTPKYELELGQ